MNKAIDVGMIILDSSITRVSNRTICNEQTSKMANVP